MKKIMIIGLMLCGGLLYAMTPKKLTREDLDPKLWETLPELMKREIADTLIPNHPLRYYLALQKEATKIREYSSVDYDGFCFKPNSLEFVALRVEVGDRISIIKLDNSINYQAQLVTKLFFSTNPEIEVNHSYYLIAPGATYPLRGANVTNIRSTDPLWSYYNQCIETPLSGKSGIFSLLKGGLAIDEISLLEAKMKNYYPNTLITSDVVKNQQKIFIGNIQKFYQKYHMVIDSYLFEFHFDPKITNWFKTVSKTGILKTGKKQEVGIATKPFNALRLYSLLNGLLQATQTDTKYDAPIDEMPYFNIMPNKMKDALKPYITLKK